MNTKLTLSVEKQVVQKAKRYAKETNRSLSEIIQSYLENLTKDETSPNISKKLKSLIGAVDLPIDFNEKETLRTYLEKKHL